MAKKPGEPPPAQFHPRTSATASVGVLGGYPARRWVLQHNIPWLPSAGRFRRTKRMFFLPWVFIRFRTDHRFVIFRNHYWGIVFQSPILNSCIAASPKNKSRGLLPLGCFFVQTTAVNCCVPTLVYQPSKKSHTLSQKIQRWNG